MSLSLVKIPVSKVFEPRIDMPAMEDSRYVILKGSKDNTYQRYPSPNVNNFQIQVTTNPPSRQMVVNRRVYVRCKYRMTFTGTAAGAGSTLLVPGLDAPRQYPFARSLNTIQATINNDQYSSTLNQYWNAFLRYQNDADATGLRRSKTPSALDAYQEYTDAYDPFSGGTAKNVLGGYGETSKGEGNRGGFAGLTIISNPVAVDGVTPITAEIELEVQEPVFMSPFLYEAKQRPGLIGVQNMSWTFTFGELSTALWAHDNVTVGHSTITSAVTDIMELDVMLNFMTLPLDMPVPENSVYPYFESVSYSQEAVTIAAGDETEITLNSVQLKSIPRRLYVFCKEQDNEMRFAQGGLSKTDTFGVISNVNVTFNNKTGLLSSASQQQLYDISYKNGTNMSWSQWSKYVGSVIALDMSEDVSLNELEASGSIGNYQLGLRVRCKNPRAVGGRAVKYVLYVVAVHEGTMSIMNGSVSHQVGVFSSQDVLDAKVDPMITYQDQKSVYGGSFFSRMKSFVTKAAPRIKKFFQETKAISKGLSMIDDPRAQVASRVAAKLGYGKKRGRPKKKKAGGVLVERGGAMLSRADLRRRLGGAGFDDSSDEDSSDEVYYGGLL